MSQVNLSTFPSSKISALTMLYLEKQDLSTLTPAQLVDKYYEVYMEISERIDENIKAENFSF